MATCSCRYLFVKEVDLPVGALNVDVQLPDAPRHIVGLSTQIGDRQRGNERQLGA
jgi:hypothetical protein